MTMRQAADTLRPRPRPWAGKLGPAALVAGIAAMAVAGIDLATRPGCPGNYVRLIDVEWALPFIAALVSVTGAVVWSRSRWQSPGRWATGLAGFALAVGVLTAGVSTAWLVHHQSSNYDPYSECWTF
jgi:hypothetical protein